MARIVRIEALRRARRERQRPTPASAEAGDALTWGELHAVLDEELGRLAAPLRAPLILLETRKRVEQLLQRLEGPSAWRRSRALQVVENIGNSEARRVLNNLAQGAA